MEMLWPLLVIVGSNTFYHISSKSIAEGSNAFLSLAVTYLVACGISLMLFFITSPSKNVIVEFDKLNWASLILGFAIVGLEFGYIYLYRVGWKLSVGSLVANVTLAIVLLVVGVLLYRESITLKQIIGMAMCAGGLALINIK